MKALEIEIKDYETMADAIYRHSADLVEKFLPDDEFKEIASHTDIAEMKVCEQTKLSLLLLVMISELQKIANGDKPNEV